MDSARHLLSTISSKRARWDAKLNVIHDQIDSVPGHALLCAASVCYLARTPPDTHRQLLTNWLGYCSGAVSLGSLAGGHGGGLQAAQVRLGNTAYHVAYMCNWKFIRRANEILVKFHRMALAPEFFYMKCYGKFLLFSAVCMVMRAICVLYSVHMQGHQSYSSQHHHQVVKIQRDFSVSSHLSGKEERCHWRQESVFPDQTSLERCLAARSACSSQENRWPFVFDPHQQFEGYLSVLSFKMATNTSFKEGTIFFHSLNLRHL